MANSGTDVFFRVDGGESVGMGHIVRCLFLASALRDIHGYPVSFLMNRDEIGISRAKECGWEVLRVELDDLGGSAEGDVLVIDVQGGVSAEAVRSLREKQLQTLIVLIDTNCTGCLEADLIVGPLEKLPGAPSRVGSRGQRFVGPAYAIVDPAFTQIRRDSSSRVPRVLVTMGGSDPRGLTLQALRAVDTMPETFETIVALGPAFLHETELKNWMTNARRQYEIRREKSLLGLVAASDLAIVSFGTNAYELAAAGLPAVALSISGEHAESAEIFSRHGSLVNLGLSSSISTDQLQGAVEQLLNDPARRLTMAQRGRSLVDGRGAERVAELIVARIKNPQRSIEEMRR